MVWFVTSLLDAKQYPAGEIVGLYARRWRIETFFKQFKMEMGADILRSMRLPAALCLACLRASTHRQAQAGPEGIFKEVAARLVATNLVRTVIVEAALQEGVDPLRTCLSPACSRRGRQVSFVYALRAIIMFSPALATEPIWKLQNIYP